MNSTSSSLNRVNFSEHSNYQTKENDNSQNLKDDESLDKLKKENEDLRKELLNIKKKVTGYVDNNTLNIIPINLLRSAILNKVQGIYDSIKVDQIEHYFGGSKSAVLARKITLNRTWTALDGAALVVPFFSALFSSKSIYTRTINENAIAEFVLDADSSEEVLEDIFEQSLAIFERKNPNAGADKIQKIREQKLAIFNNIVTTEKDAELDSFIKIFKRTQQNNDPKKDLEAAYWQSKTIVIYVPNECNQQSEVELYSAGFVTPLTIKAGKLLRSLFKESNRGKHFRLE